jgi:hypothetical protein
MSATIRDEDRDRCANPGCGESRADHDWRNHAIAHAFVEPAEAAPYEAVAIAERWFKRALEDQCCEYDTVIAGKDMESCAREAYAAGRKAAFGEAEAQRGQEWSAADEARTMLGNALYPGLDGDSPKGIANTLWAFGKEAARRLTAAWTLIRKIREAEVNSWSGTLADLAEDGCGELLKDWAADAIAQRAGEGKP